MPCVACLVAVGAAWLGYLHGANRGDQTKGVSVGMYAHRDSRRESGIASEREERGVAHLARVRAAIGNGGLGTKDRLELWRAVRDLSVTEVRDALEGLREEPRSDAHLAEIKALYFRWAQIDPAEAMKQSLLVDSKRDGNPETYPLTAWMTRDPDAAMAWLRENPSDKASRLERAAETMDGTLLAAGDPSSAIQKAAANPDLGHSILFAVGKEMSRTAEGRKAFAAMIDSRFPDGQRQYALRQMLVPWGTRDPGSALSQIGEVVADPKEAESLRTGLCRSLMLTNPSETMDWEVSHDPAFGIAKQSEMLSTWIRGDTESAMDWMREQANPDLSAATVRQSTLDLLKGGWIASGDDADDELDRLRQQVDIWRLQQPDEAGAWLKTLPADLRRGLTEEEVDVSH